LLGSHPVWEIFRSLYQMKQRPYVIGGMFIFVGYFWMLLRRAERTIPEELIEFRRKEQVQRLRYAFGRAARASITPALPGGYSASSD
jgi:poly-beta-1,6-N-acetyl-D-glucosamine synthase